MTSDAVHSSLSGGVLLITLNRPDKLNSFNNQMLSSLLSAFERASCDPAVRSVLLTGAGRAFCAGQDLGDFIPRDHAPAPDLGHTLETFYNPTLRSMRSLRKPIVCAVNGVAAGAGANIAFACDIVLAARSAKFIQAFARIGSVPDAGGTWTLPRAVGEARAKALMMTAEPLSADKAADWGLIWKAVEDADLIKEAHTLASALARGPTISLGLTKHLIQASATNDFDDQLDVERDCQRTAGRSADFLEGVSAFIEKRKTEFAGK